MKLFSAIASMILCSQTALANVTPQDTEDVKAIVESTTIRAQYNYCVAGTLTCRKLVLLSDKATGAAVEDFYDVFASAERAVGSTGYTLKNTDGTFRMIGDTTFDGKVEATHVNPVNRSVRVTFDSGGFPTIHDASILRVGTTRYIVADLVYTASESRIEGTEFDTADASYSAPVSVIYSVLK